MEFEGEGEKKRRSLIHHTQSEKEFISQPRTSKACPHDATRGGLTTLATDSSFIREENIKAK
jgi:hypothetical protein